MTYPNNSSTGGYLLPAPADGEFGGLSLEDFLQTVFVGVSGLKGDLVRPKWQVDAPKNPDINVNWLGIALIEDDADVFAYDGVDSVGNNQFMRMEALTIQCSFYGPQAHAFMRVVRDGLQLSQNRAALQSVNMDFVSTSRGTRVPDFINERWVDRWEMTAYFRRQDMRVYPVLTFVSGSGVLQSNVSSGVKEVEITIDQQEGNS